MSAHKVTMVISLMRPRRANDNFKKCRSGIYLGVQGAELPPGSVLDEMLTVTSCNLRAAGLERLEGPVTMAHTSHILTASLSRGGGNTVADLGGCFGGWSGGIPLRYIVGDVTVTST